MDSDKLNQELTLQSIQIRQTRVLRPTAGQTRVLRPGGQREQGLDNNKLNFLTKVKSNLHWKHNHHVEVEVSSRESAKEMGRYESLPFQRYQTEPMKRNRQQQQSCSEKKGLGKIYSSLSLDSRGRRYQEQGQKQRPVIFIRDFTSEKRENTKIGNTINFSLFKHKLSEKHKADYLVAPVNKSELKKMKKKQPEQVVSSTSSFLDRADIILPVVKRRQSNLMVVKNRPRSLLLDVSRCLLLVNGKSVETKRSKDDSKEKSSKKVNKKNKRSFFETPLSPWVEPGRSTSQNFYP